MNADIVTTQSVRRAMRETFERLWAEMSAGADHAEAVKRVLGNAAVA